MNAFKNTHTMWNDTKKRRFFSRKITNLNSKLINDVMTMELKRFQC